MLDPHPQPQQNATGMKVHRSALAALAIVGLAMATLNCRFLEQIWDRNEGCHDTRIALVNDEQTRADAFIVSSSEPVVEAYRLHSGDSREISLCTEIGHNYGFHVLGANGELLVTSHCPASRRAYENSRPEVRWTPAGFLCVGW